MKTLNPIEDLINKTARLYFDLCQIAEETYQMGPYSGAKRTILLYVNQRGTCFADEIYTVFPDPLLAKDGAKIILDLAQSRYLTTEYQQGRPLLTLTDAGRAKVQEIVQREAKLVKDMPEELQVGELRRMAKTLELFRSAMLESAEDPKLKHQHEEAS